MALDEKQLAELVRMLAVAQAKASPPAQVIPFPVRPSPLPQQAATA